MKTNKTIQTLCSLLGRCRPELDDLAAHSHGETKYFQARYRNIALLYSQAELPQIKDQPIPSKTGHFIVKPVVENNMLYEINVYQKTLQHLFTTLDCFVSADGIPTLVETRILNPKNIDTYFVKYPQKLGVLKTLFPNGFGWILMLPLDYIEKQVYPLPAFEECGGNVAIMPYTYCEMSSAVEKYSRHGSDTKLLVK